MSFEHTACFTAIGVVESGETRKKDAGWAEGSCTIRLRPELAAGLAGIGAFSHLLVVTHLHQAAFAPEKHLQRQPQGRADMPEVGIFAQRAKDRPNPIGITAVRLLAAGEGLLTVAGLDAIDGTPVLDIKPYYPQYDCREGATVPQWVDRLMDGYF